MNIMSLGSPAGAIEGARSSDLSGIQWLLNLRNLPSEDITPAALDHLKQLEFPTEGLRSKSWNEFATPGLPAEVKP